MGINSWQLKSQRYVKNSKQNKKDFFANLEKETLEVCEKGHYRNLKGGTVKFKKELRDARDNTFLIKAKDNLTTYRRESAKESNIVLKQESTIDTLQNLREIYPEEKILLLNFASAKNPGGGFLRGSQAQEESLARSSGLYPCLQEIPEFYDRDKGDTLYSSDAIYSENVPFIRDNQGHFLQDFLMTDVLTIAAPNASAAMEHGERDKDIESALKK